MSFAAPEKKRKAMKMNSVTGKFEEVERREGGNRDGCLQLDDKYINAAFDAGLGGAEGMYGHMKSLNKVGGGTVPGITRSGPSSMSAPAKEAAGESTKSFMYSSGHGKKASTGDDVPVKPWQRGRLTRPGAKAGAGAPRAGHVIKTGHTATGKRGTVKQMVNGRTRTVRSGASGGKSGADAVHFNKFKGVVNTLGGTHDVARRERLSKNCGDLGSMRGGASSGLKTTSTKKGGAIAQLDHSSGGSISKKRGGYTAGVVSGGVTVHAPSKGVLKESRVVGNKKRSGGGSTSGGQKLGSRKASGGALASAGRRIGSSGGAPTGEKGLSGSRASGGSRKAETRKLGGGKSGGSAAPDAAALRAQRAAFFEKKFAAAAPR